MADENQKRKFGFIWTVIFALLGAIGFWIGRRKQKQYSISEHIQTHEK
jgi:tryptophan-rich sensory protein